MAFQHTQHNSNLFMVMVYLRGAFPKEHSRYLGQQTCLPIKLLVRQMRTRLDNIFTKLWSMVPKTDKKLVDSGEGVDAH